MEGFLLQLQQQVVVVGFDGDRGGFAAVDDARYRAGATQAAARTRSLQIARIGDDFKLHVDTPEWISRSATRTGRLKKLSR
jgi:hypothetical protein